MSHGSSSEHLPAQRLRNLTLLVIIGAVWGTQPALIKSLTERGLPQLATLGLAMVFVAAGIATVLAPRGRLPQFTPETTVFMAITSGTQYAGPLLVVFLVANYIDAGLLTLIMFTFPLFTVATAAAFGVERIDRYGSLGCVAGLIGLALIAIPQDALPSPDMLPWCMAAFSIPVMYALGGVYTSKAWPSDMDSLQVACGGTLLAGLVLMPFWVDALASGTLLASAPAEYLIFFALVATFIVEMVLYLYAIRHAGPVFASFASFVSIITGFVVGALFFGERPSHWILASVVFFLLALMLILLRPVRTAREEPRGKPAEILPPPALP